MRREASRETGEWLNSQILVGFTEKNGNPWWFNRDFQGEESTVYPGAIPAKDVERRLFSWKAESWPVLLQRPDGTSMELPDRRAIVHGETGEVFRVGHKSYVMHQFIDWLVDNVSHILDSGELHIGSAGLLRRGAGAFVTVERPENVVSKSGMALRSRLLAATSHDSKLATTYKLVNTIVVCDNTLDNALYREWGQKHRTRHTPNSIFRIPDVREALEIMVQNDHDVVEFIDSLADMTVSERQWQEIVERLVEVPEDSLPRVKARLENKRNKLDELWRTDYRCTPWKGSALGAFQVFNTYRFHFAGPSASDTPNLEQRFNRNMESVISDKALIADRELLTTITSIASNN
jgi:phage/plasmid-like protein (TIGR03299 family)